MKIDQAIDAGSVDKDLIQLYEWLPKDEVPFLQKELDRILLDVSRTAMLVKRGVYYSVFANDVSVNYNHAKNDE